MPPEQGDALGLAGKGYEPERATTDLNEEVIVGGAFGKNANGEKLVLSI